MSKHAHELHRVLLLNRHQSITIIYSYCYYLLHESQKQNVIKHSDSYHNSLIHKKCTTDLQELHNICHITYSNDIMELPLMNQLFLCPCYFNLPKISETQMIQSKRLETNSIKYLCNGSICTQQ